MSMPVDKPLQAAEMELDAHPLAGRIGARIDGIQLAAGLPDATIAAIEAALSKYKVIFFRDQAHLDDNEQERLAARFGEVVPHPTYRARAGSTAILELDSTGGLGRADRWHTDVTFVDKYPRLSLLRAVVIPPCGGDTVWANTVAAYEELPPALKMLADNIWGVHFILYVFGAVRQLDSVFDSREYIEDILVSV